MAHEEESVDLSEESEPEFTPRDSVTLTDEELMAVHGALVSSIPPGEMMLVMRWMVPFMAPAERVALLGEMRQQAPAEAFGAVLDVVRPHLTAREWDKLMAGLGMAAAAAR